MKRAGNLIIAFAVLTILFSIATPMASAQELLGEWYKVNCQVIARQVNPSTGAVTAYNRTFTAYYNFYYYGIDYNGAYYYFSVWVKQYTGEWEECWSSGSYTDDVTGRIIIDQQVHFDDGQGYIYTYSTPYINPDHTYLWAMGEVYTGVNSLGNNVHGGIIITGSKVTSLPFAVPPPASALPLPPGQTPDAPHKH